MIKEVAASLLAEYKRQLEELDTEILQSKSEIRLLQKELSAKETQRVKLKAEIERLLQAQPKEVKISDHAVVRYLERIEGLDIEETKKKILTEETLSLLERMKYSNGTYPTRNGFRVTVRENVVVTVGH